MKYILIWKYHDTNVFYFDTKEQLLQYLNGLKQDYKYDSDFNYEIYYAIKIEWWNK